MTERHERIRELYDAALKLPIGERAAFVAARAGDDAELRKRVESLLVGQDETRFDDERGSSGASPSVQAFAPGASIGAYRLESALGVGGMGVVYRATDTKLNRPAAIKILPEDLATHEARGRFQREAQMVSSLNHPHIVTVYDAGEYLGRQCLITELVDGGTLREWATRPRPWRQIVELLIGVADGVATAHDAGILHRDIKPENILLAKNGYAKLADFGIAKLFAAEEQGDARPSIAHPADQSTYVGTLAYMSPEQSQGLPLDARSDVFSFGLVLFELLAGRRPFDAQDRAKPHYERAPAPRLPDELPAELRTIVAKALELDPADRYQTMRDLVVDLRHLARRSGIDAAEDTTRRRAFATPWLKFALAGGVALVLLGALARSYMRVVPEAVPNSVAVLPFANESANDEDLYISEGVGDSLRRELGKLPDLRVKARASSIVFRDREQRLDEIATRLGARMLISGSLRRRGETLNVEVEIVDRTGSLVWSDRFERHERELLALERDLARQVTAHLVPTASTASTGAQQPGESSSAHELLLLGQLYENQVRDEIVVDERKLDTAIDFYRRAIDADKSSELAHSRLAGALLYRGADGDVDEAEVELLTALSLGESSWTHYTRALYVLRRGLVGAGEAYERAIALDSSNADALRGYALWQWGHGDVSVAGEFFRRAVETDPESLAGYEAYAEYLGTTGRREDALALAKDIRARFPPSARVYRALARLHEVAGDLDLAIAWGLQALTLDPGDLFTAEQVAEFYARIGDFEKASSYEPDAGIGQLFWRRRYDEVIERDDWLIDHPGDLDVRYLIAFAYNARNQFENTKKSLNSVNLIPKAFSDGSTAPDVQALTTLADALRSTGENAEADKLTQWLIDIHTRQIATGMAESWWAQLHLACAYANRGQASEALAALERIDPRFGLPWAPLLKDSVCFRGLASEPRYRAVVASVEAREAELRERLPNTLREHRASLRTNVAP